MTETQVGTEVAKGGFKVVVLLDGRVTKRSDDVIPLSATSRMVQGIMNDFLSGLSTAFSFAIDLKIELRKKDLKLNPENGRVEPYLD